MFILSDSTCNFFKWITFYYIQSLNIVKIVLLIWKVTLSHCMKTIIYKYTLEKSKESITNEQYSVNGNICAQKTQDEENTEGENSLWRSCGWSCNVEIYIVKWRNILIIVFYSHKVLKLYMRVCHFNPIRKTLAWPHHFTKRWHPDQYKNNIYKTTFWLNYLCLIRKLSIYFCRCFYDLSIELWNRSNCVERYTQLPLWYLQTRLLW